MKVILRTFLEFINSLAITDEFPGIILITPFGYPISLNNIPNAKDVYGVYVAGFITHVQPTKIATAIFRAVIAAGKFHGVITPTTPIGSLCAIVFYVSSSYVVYGSYYLVLFFAKNS